MLRRVVVAIGAVARASDLAAVLLFTSELSMNELVHHSAVKQKASMQLKVVAVAMQELQNGSSIASALCCRQDGID